MGDPRRHRCPECKLWHGAGCLYQFRVRTVEEVVCDITAFTAEELTQLEAEIQRLKAIGKTVGEVLRS